MSRVRNLITAAALAAAIGCATAPAAPRSAGGPAKSGEAPTLMSTVKPDEIEVARPGGKVPNVPKLASCRAT